MLKKLRETRQTRPARRIAQLSGPALKRPLPLAALLALGIALPVLLLQEPPAPPRPIQEVGHADADSSYTNVHYWMRDAQGGPLYKVTAAQLDQYADDRRARVQAPQVRWLEPDFKDSWARARHGEIRQLQIALRDEVEILLAPARHVPTLLRGSALVLDTAQRQIRSSATVSLAQADAAMRGTGLRYRLDATAGELRRDVRARQFPAHAQSPTYGLLTQVLNRAFGSAHAQEPSAGTLDLTADRMSWDARQRVYVYHGNVRASLDTMVLRADKVTAHADESHVQVLHAEGNAVWTQTLDSGKPLHAWADSIYYQFQKRRAILRKDVRMKVGEHSFAGDHLVYLLDEERLETSSEKSDPGRVRLRLRTEP